MSSIGRWEECACFVVVSDLSLRLAAIMRGNSSTNILKESIIVKKCLFRGNYRNQAQTLYNLRDEIKEEKHICGFLDGS